MSEPADRILIADDESNLRKLLGALLRREGYAVQLAADGEEALEAFEQERFSVVITDLRMPHMDGMTLLKRLLEKDADLPVIVITAHGTVDTAVEALKIGAFDFITKPYDKDELTRVVAKAVHTRRLNLQASRPLQVAPAEGRFGLIGTSPAMQRVFNIVEKVAATPSTVLITGESGTGKELIAKALHAHSSRADRPFIRVNCAAIPDTLIESELFGYEKGAFTGAVTSKPGRFELAHEGTLFLDEIGEVSTEMQVKLLRAIQESEFERVGGITTRRVDVRLVTATNRDLAQQVREGRFRDDLYYRLNVVPLHLPPLRARLDDIPLLVDHILARYAVRLGRTIEGLDTAAMQVLLQYAWPGNIRELENVLERTLLFCDGPVIRRDDLPAELREGAGPVAASPAPPAGVTGLKDAVKLTTQRLEREMIERALDETGGNVTRAARKLEISRKSLQTKMKELGLREDG
ncbi:MAG: sigma-54-dependent Fis family transcriptional regulator [Myxococcales bacterium]|nr:sigma-54-dependent Fis family transcriptional regulator [Myxococcales bacterium]